MRQELKIGIEYDQHKNKEKEVLNPLIRNKEAQEQEITIELLEDTDME